MTAHPSKQHVILLNGNWLHVCGMPRFNLQLKYTTYGQISHD